MLSTDVNNSKSLYSQIYSSNDSIIEEDNIEGVVNFVSKLEKFESLEMELEKQVEQEKLKENQLNKEQENQCKNNNKKLKVYKKKQFEHVNVENN